MQIVEIRRNSDGAVRSCEYPYPWDGDYIWTDGNYGCDCNRALFFGRADGGEGDEADCGEGAYAVRIKDTDGNVLYEDDAWANAIGSSFTGDDAPIAWPRCEITGCENGVCVGMSKSLCYPHGIELGAFTVEEFEADRAKRHGPGNDDQQETKP